MSAPRKVRECEIRRTPRVLVRPPDWGQPASVSPNDPLRYARNSALPLEFKRTRPERWVPLGTMNAARDRQEGPVEQIVGYDTQDRPLLEARIPHLRRRAIQSGIEPLMID